MIASIHVVQSLQQALNGLLGFIPNLIGFLIILGVGFLIARAVKVLVTALLRKAKLDHALHSGHSGRYIDRISPEASPAALVGAVVFWLIFLFVLTAAIGALRIPSVTAFMNQVLNYLPNVIAAVIIFVIAGAIATAVGGAVAKLMGDTPTGKVAGTAVPVLIMGIAMFMILNQLRIAPAIVQITYVALLGSVALGSALAFGLGGREVAGQMLAQAYENGRRNAGQIKADMRTGKERGQEQAARAQDVAQQKLDEDGEPAARRRP